jgi:hypothetical protein
MLEIWVLEPSCSDLYANTPTIVISTLIRYYEASFVVSNPFKEL